MKKNLTRGLAVLAGFALPALASAQNFNYDYGYDDYYYDDYGTSTGSAALGVGILIFIGIMGLISLVALAFVIWMIVDAAKRDFDQKVLWILLMVFIGFIPAVIYYFMIKRKNVTGSGKPAATVPQATPETPAAEPPKPQEPQQ
ncbi:MAG: PLDc N-terminal domain-containing protein [bacterium]|nr:PLDc N-terminal domain-containing protein [bacterium]